MDQSQIERIVLEAIRSTNLREQADRVAESVDAPLFGGEGPLDSLGLVALLMEVEEGLLEEGAVVSLSDERAMSQRQSPFRSVTSLVEYIQSVSDVEKNAP